MIQYADGDKMDMKGIAMQVGIKLTSVEAYAAAVKAYF